MKQLILFADDLAVSIENPKEYKNRFWDRITKFRKVNTRSMCKKDQIYFYLLTKIF